ncbi:hypothetical protein [Erysipelothrix aquatica]|uniref:hypothetical protein n=1 Tax=Erysipelothrix aquatica TaxID=2683714 RepID=UPI00135BD14E|nr:hypothetical protein [Erysipelothrix aquatica]
MVKKIISNYRDSIIIALDISFFYIVLSSIKYGGSVSVFIMLVLRSGFIILRNYTLHNERNTNASRKSFVIALAIALDHVLFYFILIAVFNFEIKMVTFFMFLRACTEMLLFSKETTKYKDFRGNVWFRNIVLILLDSILFFMILYQVYDGNILPVIGFLIIREMTTFFVVFAT